MVADTITAIATPLGEGGLSVIRLSGPEALAIADRCFQPVGRTERPSEYPTHTVHYGRIRQDGRTVDEVLLTVMRAPRTFTREDVVEISGHGGILVAKTVLDVVLRAGARLAEPGEFTQRAFLNGRIDLAQAEAVADLIHARTELALAAANEQLAGTLSQRVNELRDRLMATLAHVEAHIDFPDEDITPATMSQLQTRLAEALSFMDELLRTAGEGQLLRRGIRAAIIGRPNVGKSSLLNQLLGRDRAIVSTVAGTTRDTIEETANIRGIPVVLIDTAGIRDGGDSVELEGIRRSYATISQADLIIQVLDQSEPLSESDEKDLDAFAAKKRILVANKKDLPSELILPDGLEPEPVRVCSLTGDGLEPLKEAIKEAVWSGEIRAEMLQVMINSRHQDALQRAHTACEQSLAGLREGRDLELVAVDLRIGVDAVGEIVGKTSTEDLLDSIFGQFCLGK